MELMLNPKNLEQLNKKNKNKREEFKQKSVNKILTFAL